MLGKFAPLRWQTKGLVDLVTNTKNNAVAIDDGSVAGPNTLHVPVVIL